jgi:high-affinity iron transporter
MLAAALPSALIVFREVLEAGLIVGVILAATEGVAGRSRWVAGGVGAGILGATTVALFAAQLSSAFEGSGQNIFNAAILIAAVGMLSWHILWMSRHAREMVADMNSLGSKLASGEATLFAMAAVVAVAVLREGSEVVLFLFGIAASGGAQPLAMFAGGLAGVAGGAGLSWLIYRGLLAVPTAKLFSVTNGLIALLASGMAGQAAVYLAQAGLIPSLGDELWDTSGILADDSLPGRALHALVGYSDRPMGVQLLAYLVVLGALIALGRAMGPKADENPAAQAKNPPAARRHLRSGPNSVI